MSDILLGHVWVQTDCKMHQQTVAKESMWPFGQFSIKSFLVLIRMPHGVASNV